MSSSILPLIQSELNRYGYPIFLTLGNIGNLFIVILFSRQRQNPCAIYLLSLAIMNNLYLTFNSLVQIFPFNYRNPTVSSLAACKIRFYLSNILGQMAKTMLILACIDRFMITNNRAHFRAFSRPLRAKIFILFTLIVWPLFASHIAIMTTIVNGQCGTFGIYSTFYTIYTILFVGLIPIILLGLFGYLTHRQIQQSHARVQSTGTGTINQNHSLQRRDREFLVIVISEVSVYVITTTPYPLILLEMMISRYVISDKSIQYSQIESFIFTIAFLLLFLNNVAPFYLYLIVSKSFRREFHALMMNIYRKLRRQQIVPMSSGITNPTFAQRDSHI